MSQHVLETELNRILTRLSHLNDQQRTLAAPLVHATAQRIRGLTSECGDDGPNLLPLVDPRVADAQLQVLCADLCTVADENTLETATAQLTELRRSLP